MGTLLRYPYEVRAENEYFDEIQDVKVTKEHARPSQAYRQPEGRGGSSRRKFEDQYEAALVDLINKKRARPADCKERPPRPAANVVDLMEALRRSVGGAEAGEDPRKASQEAAQVGLRPEGNADDDRGQEGQGYAEEVGVQASRRKSALAIPRGRPESSFIQRGFA